MFHVGRFDESKLAVPEEGIAHSRGSRRVSLMDRTRGSVHMGVGLCELEAGGFIKTRIHANEKGVYVIEGALDVKRGDECFQLGRDEYALIPYGVPHAFRNSGKRRVRWFEMQAPQPKPPGGWQDTFFVKDDGWPAKVPVLGAAPVESAGHFKPGKALVPEGPGIRGLAAYRFMDRAFGAQHFLMMRGELQPGGVRSTHDHPIEEFYFALGGESFMDIEGKRFHLHAGDVAWTGVGTSHAFTHTGAEPFRWIETQAPQFPAQNGTRNYLEWDKFDARGT